MWTKTLGLIAALTFGLAGCGGGTDDATASATGPQAASALTAVKAIVNAGDVARNGGFESGTAYWTVSSSTGATLIDAFTDARAYTGSRYARLGGRVNSVDSISQVVSIPASGTTARIQFAYAINNFSVQAEDFLHIEVYSTTGTKLATAATMSNFNSTGGAWSPSTYIDIGAFRGQTVEIRFTAINDATRPTTFELDDITIFPSGLGGVDPWPGIWWNAQESGTGFTIHRQGSIILLSAYSYEEATGAPVWYTAVLTEQPDRTWAGSWNRYSDGQPFGGTYRAPAAPQTIGTVSLVFDSDVVGALAINLPGKPQRWVPITKLRLNGQTLVGSYQTCSDGLYWNPQESGSGFGIEVQADNAVLVSYTYDETGQPTWYLGSARTTSIGSFSVALQGYRAGQSLAGAYLAPIVGATLGTATLTCTSRTSAELTLPNGRVVPLQRFTS